MVTYSRSWGSPHPKDCLFPILGQSFQHSSEAFRRDGRPSDKTLSSVFSNSTCSKRIMSQRILIYLLRRDLRLADNPIFNEVAKIHSQSHAPFTHVLPLYVFPAQQIEISGFIPSGEKSPYPEARSQIGHFWRCGPHRAKFMAESVWDVKHHLERVGSGLEIRVGVLQDVVRQVVDSLKGGGREVMGLWMTKEQGIEEMREERAVRKEVEQRGKEFKLWTDEKYFVDEYVLIQNGPSRGALTIRTTLVVTCPTKVQHSIQMSSPRIRIRSSL